MKEEILIAAVSAIIFLCFIVIICIKISVKRKKREKEAAFNKNNKEKTDIYSVYEDMEYPYQSKMLLTITEYKFYRLLKSFCDANDLLVCPKVRLEDFIAVDTEDYSSLQRFRGYIKSRHVDFLITDCDLYILAGIELDDKSHESESAKAVDEFKNNLFETIDIPLYRVKTDSDYELELEEIISEIV